MVLHLLAVTDADHHALAADLVETQAGGPEKRDKVAEQFGDRPRAQPARQCRGLVHHAAHAVFLLFHQTLFSCCRVVICLLFE
ncbi:hypothetical protein D3C78_1653750 [compost metagenome]